VAGAGHSSRAVLLASLTASVVGLMIFIAKLVLLLRRSSLL